MYTELAEVSEAGGKTVSPQGITYASGKVIIAFTDETFLIFAAVENYDEEIFVLRQGLNFEDFFHGDLVKAGIMTIEEADQKRKERNEEYCRASEEAQRRQYERLKAKFEHGE